MVWRWQERLSNVPTADPASEKEISEFTPAARALRRKTHQTIARISDEFDDLHFNTNVSALMELFNELSDFNADPANATSEDVFVVRKPFRRWL